MFEGSRLGIQVSSCFLFRLSCFLMLFFYQWAKNPPSSVWRIGRRSSPPRRDHSRGPRRRSGRDRDRDRGRDKDRDRDREKDGDRDRTEAIKLHVPSDNPPPLADPVGDPRLQEWVTRGANDASERARADTHHICDQHKTEHLDRAEEDAIEAARTYFERRRVELQDEADVELAKFRKQLKIETQERKDAMQFAAEAA